MRFVAAREDGIFDTRRSPAFVILFPTKPLSSPRIQKDDFVQMSSRRRSSRLKTGPMDVDLGDAASQADDNANYTSLNLPADFPYEDLQLLLPPDASIESPSQETIMHVYSLLLDLNGRAEQASEELDATKAAYQKLEVEAEQAQIDSQNEVSRMNSNLLKLAGDVKDLRKKEIEWGEFIAFVCVARLSGGLS